MALKIQQWPWLLAGHHWVDGATYCDGEERKRQIWERRWRNEANFRHIGVEASMKYPSESVSWAACTLGNNSGTGVAVWAPELGRHGFSNSGSGCLATSGLWASHSISNSISLIYKKGCCGLLHRVDKII